MCEKALISRGLWHLQGGFSMSIILSNAVKSRLWEHIKWQAQVDRMTLGVGCVDRIIVVDRIDE
ncbi:hypothetical protein [Porcipelethomonas sp.]|uniref:hypothetical protein n=1 Tax=Porcipelethomonas sp. TaxID=2981675 RepID=UPI003078CD8C